MLGINELKKIYKNKKVLITGHNGFKGTYICILLKYLGAKVYGYALKSEKNSLYDIVKKESKTFFPKSENNNIVEDECIADIRDYKKLKEYVKKVEPDFILHMSAQALVLKSYEEPLYTYDVNVMGTANLMEAIREVFCEKKKKTVLSVLNVTTDKVYENNDLSDYAFKENDKLCGYDPYANSKSCSELVTYSYKKSFFDNSVSDIRVSTARAGNVIGGGDMNENRIIPDCFRAVKNKTDMEVRNPDSIRPYQYVFEPLIIYLNIMAYQLEDKKYIGNYNIGPDKKSCLTTKELVDLFYIIWDTGTKINYAKKVDVKKAKHEATFLRLDNSLIKKVFAYKEIFKMQDTMRHTTEVYKLILEKKPILPYICDIFDEIK